jgi:hypothetical protein
MAPVYNLHALMLLDDAREWRSRAEEWRVIAEGMHDQNCKQRAYRIADDYDGMAKQAEERTGEPTRLKEKTAGP